MDYTGETCHFKGEVYFQTGRSFSFCYQKDYTLYKGSLVTIILTLKELSNPMKSLSEVAWNRDPTSAILENS